jgi:hypothetical protein
MAMMISISVNPSSDCPLSSCRLTPLDIGRRAGPLSITKAGLNLMSDMAEDGQLPKGSRPLTGIPPGMVVGTGFGAVVTGRVD